MAQQIYLGLKGLRARNGFHEFEALCHDFANATLGGGFVPATGPVSARGDRGQDFVSFLRLIPDGADVAFADKVVGICTLQVDNPSRKICSDLRAVAADKHVKAVYAFLTADLPIGKIQDLQKDALTDHSIRLEVFDGFRLADNMARADFATIAYRRLNLDQRSLSAIARATDEARRWARETTPGSFHPEFHSYLTAVRETSRRHPWAFVDGIPDLDKLYQPQTLVDPNGASRAWQTAMERSEHLFITGPAGLGKSSLLQHIAATLSDQWLSNEAQPWMPVPIHARDLAVGKSLSQSLAEGVERQLSSLLQRPLETDFFDREPMSARWLILVDGLDEVRDHDQRQDILRTAESATRSSSMRFVITSRPGGASSVPKPFLSYELQPFTSATARRFIGQWTELHARPSKDLKAAIDKSTALLQRSRAVSSPLLLLMVCTLADNDPPRPLETLDQIYTEFVDRLLSRLEPAGEQVISDLQAQIHTLLETVASQHLFEDIDVPLLNLFVESAALRGITPPARLKADWRRTVEDVLLRSGLLTKRGGQLDFLHATLEEYYAVRKFPDLSPEDLVDLLAKQEVSYDSVVDLVSVNLHLLELLVARTGEADSAVAAIVEAYPSAVMVVIEQFEHYELGERTADALRTVMSDRFQDLDVQAQAATALDDLEPGDGLSRRLALSIDLDMDDTDRLNVISGLVRHGGDVAAAIQWLTFETLDNTLDSAWKYEAGPLVTFAVSTEDRARGLRLIASSTELPEHHRLAACCDLAQYDEEEAYRLLRSFTKTRWLAMSLTDSRRESYAPTLLRRFVLDDTVAFTHRLDAIEYVEDAPHWARSLYDALADSHVLTDQQRAAVTSSAERLARD